MTSAFKAPDDCSRCTEGINNVSFLMAHSDFFAVQNNLQLATGFQLKIQLYIISHFILIRNCMILMNLGDRN